MVFFSIKGKGVRMGARKKINSQMKSFLDYLSGPFYVGMKLSSSQRFWSSPGHLLFRYVPLASADGPAKGTRGEQKIIGSRDGVPPKPVMWWTLMVKSWPSQALERKLPCLGSPAICETPIQCVRAAVGCVLKGVCSNGHKPQDPKRVRGHQATVIFLYLKRRGRPISAKAGH